VVLYNMSVAGIRVVEFGPYGFGDISISRSPDGRTTLYSSRTVATASLSTTESRLVICVRSASLSLLCLFVSSSTFTTPSTFIVFVCIRSVCRPDLIVHVWCVTSQTPELRGC